MRIYNVLPVVLALIEMDGKILLGRRAHRPFRDKWDLPGGKVNPREALEAAVIREIVEETTLNASQMKLEGAFHYLGNEGSPAIFLLFRILSFHGRIELTEEMPEFGWHKSEDLETLDLTPWARHFLLK